MIIYRCDKCGHEHEVKGIVRNAYDSHGFQELSVPLPGDIRDVCKSCFNEIRNASIAAKREEKDSYRSRLLEKLGMA